jgi:hypothetical protein
MEKAKYSRYTAKDKEWIKTLFDQGRTDAEIASIMGRTEVGIMVKRRQMGLHRPDCVAISQAAGKKWSKEELTFIRNYWKELSDLRMAKKLRVSVSCYKHKRQRMGLTKDWEQKKGRRRSWTFSQELFLTQNYATHSAADIARHLGKKENTVQYKAKRMGLKKDYIPGRKGYKALEID